jgi:hypothetical protein
MIGDFEFFAAVIARPLVELAAGFVIGITLTLSAVTPFRAWIARQSAEGPRGPEKGEDEA